MLETAGQWLADVIADFRALPPTEQVNWMLENGAKVGGAVIALGGALVWLSRAMRKQEAANHRIEPTEPSSPFSKASAVFDPPIGQSQPAAFVGPPRWEYQWEIGDSLTQRAVEPPLDIALAREVQRAGEFGQARLLIFVRGELGIGKSTLRALLREQLASAGKISAVHDQRVANFLQTCSVFEADDLEPPHAFAQRISAATEMDGAVIALARPPTLDIVERRLGRSADKAVTMLPFQPGQHLFHECITNIANKFMLSAPEGRDKLLTIASNFDEKILQTPFYFEQAARAIAADPDIKVDGTFTPLQVFQRSIEQRVTELGGSFADLIQCALGKREADRLPQLSGIIGENGFVHDGYRSILLAVAFLNRGESFEEIAQCENVIPAIKIILSHMKSTRRARKEAVAARYELELRDFVMQEPRIAHRYYPIYIQGRIADAFRALGDEAPAHALRARCMKLIDLRASRTFTPETDDASLLWDVSDALSDIGDPRLRKAARERFSSQSGYFVHVPKTQIIVGSAHVPARADTAKPVLPYARSTIDIGPFWVANFLVTNELFRQFWDDPERKKYYQATGAQWIAETPSLIEKIETAFDISATRCFWKEMHDKEAIQLLSSNSELPTPLQLARRRALRPNDPTQVELWNDSRTDERFSAKGKPVVGVNWWEAMAFCEWWTATKLPRADFPAGSKASLLADWEWEAIRRKFYEAGTDAESDAAIYAPNRYPAHTRIANASPHGGRISNVMRPLHVGISLSPTAGGPSDLVGNVWEWTRSRVFGQIVASEEVTPNFGPTSWDDGDREAEQIPRHPDRDITDQKDDLSYRAVRGGSFFSRDEQAAWNPAYRLCDPPFSSYIDLGFRFAIYPQGVA